MVQLDSTNHEGETRTRRFQFHYGSIRFDQPQIFKLRFSEFQFHYGSIRFIAVDVVKMHKNKNFNSTMVQLDF